MIFFVFVLVTLNQSTLSGYLDFEVAAELPMVHGFCFSSYRILSGDNILFMSENNKELNLSIAYAFFCCCCFVDDF